LQDYIIIILLIAVIALLVAVLIRQKKPASGDSDEKIDEISHRVALFSETMNNEFERSRRESSATQTQMRKETTDALEAIRSDMEKLKDDSADRSARLERGIIRSLNAIQKENADRSDKQAEMLSEAVEKMRESNEKKLEEMRNTVDEKLTDTLTTRLDSSFKAVSDRLESVNKSLGEMKELSNGVTTNVTSLNRVLTNVKARGTWAEVQLEAILDETIPGMYEKNFSAVNGSGERVEFAVRIPSSEGNTVYLPIDSKFPMEDYIRLCDAADSADPIALEAARKALENRVTEEAKTISKYINIPLTTPYAILYLATEGLYAEIVSSKKGVAEKIRSDYNIMIAGPSTITALLNSLSLGFRAVAINERANEVRLLLGAARQQYDSFGNTLSKVRKKLDEAGSALDEADKRNGIIVKKLKAVESIDGNAADDILGINEFNHKPKEENT